MRTMSGKVKWAIGLLVVWMVLGFGQLVQDAGSTSFLLVIVTLMECLPTIAVIVLTHYDHKYESPANGTFTLLRVWALVLIWVQPVLSLLSYIAAGTFTAFLFGVWVASCLFPLIAFILLFVDGKSGQPQENFFIAKPVSNDLLNKQLDISNDTGNLLAGNLKKVKSTLERNRTYYFDNSDILRLYQMSLIDGELDIPLLKNNVYTFDDEIADKQNEIEQIVEEQVPYYSKEYALKHACRYAKTHNASTEDITKYLDSLYGQVTEKTERNDKKNIISDKKFFLLVMISVVSFIAIASGIILSIIL